MAETLAEDSGQGPVYETVEQPMWKSYLYQLQQKAPPPKRIICRREIPKRPPHYGREFHGCISREEADELVSECDGCYLVRESQRSPGSYTLTMRFGGVSKNFRLYYDGMHYVGEKRFQTIQDLVADGLITMYIDTYAKDYVDTMMIEAVKPPSRGQGAKSTKDVGNGLLKDSEEADGANKDRKFSAEKRPSVKPSLYKKPHNFKMNTFRGPHWCDFCRNFLWGLIQQGVKCQDCGYNAHKQCSEVAPPECQPDKKYVRRVFGVDLTTLVKLNNTKRPFVVDICVKEVEKRGLESEGIYRVSGFADEIEELKTCCDNKDGNSINLSTYEDINTITGTLKLYFRLLPLPLITFETYKNFIDAIKLTDEYDQVQALSLALTELPHPHYETLKYLMGHLYRVAQKKDKNMMTEENLSIVFGPTLMRSPEVESLDSLGDLKFQRLVVERLISLQDVLFDSA